MFSFCLLCSLFAFCVTLAWKYGKQSCCLYTYCCCGYVSCFCFCCHFSCCYTILVPMKLFLYSLPSFRSSHSRCFTLLLLHYAALHWPWLPLGFWVLKFAWLGLVWLFGKLYAYLLTYLRIFSHIGMYIYKQLALYYIYVCIYTYT